MTFDEAKTTLDRARRMSVHEQRGNRIEITDALKVALLESKNEEEFTRYADGIVMFSALLYFVLNRGSALK